MQQFHISQVNFRWIERKLLTLFSSFYDMVVEREL